MLSEWKNVSLHQHCINNSQKDIYIYNNSVRESQDRDYAKDEKLSSINMVIVQGKTFLYMTAIVIVTAFFLTLSSSNTFSWKSRGLNEWKGRKLKWSLMEKVLVLVDMKKCIVWKFLSSSSLEIIWKEFFVMNFHRKNYCWNSTNRLLKILFK